MGKGKSRGIAKTILGFNIFKQSWKFETFSPNVAASGSNPQVDIGTLVYSGSLLLQLKELMSFSLRH